MTLTSNMITADLFLAVTALADAHGCDVKMNPDGTIVLTPPNIGTVTVTIDPA